MRGIFVITSGRKALCPYRVVSQEAYPTCTVSHTELSHRIVGKQCSSQEAYPLVLLAIREGRKPE